jgi:dihydrolipoamide dehydrogenase
MSDARDAVNFGLTFDQLQIDIERLREWKNQVVTKLTGGLAQLSKQRAVNYVQGYASFIDSQTISVAKPDGSSLTVESDYVILATGSRPLRPVELAVETARVLDSTTALDLSRVPKNLLVVGGGYIGLELGTIYGALGSEVTIVERASGLMPGVDRDLVNILVRRLETCTEAIHLDTMASRLNPISEGIEVELNGPKIEKQKQVFDSVLVAVGRRPNSDLQGLERTSVELDERSFIQVDRQCKTAEATVFAIGDLVGEPMLAHKAFHEARVAVETIMGHDTSFEPMAIPAVVFTDPEVAWCGLTETQASKDQIPISVSRFPWAASGRALTLDRPDGMTKLVIDTETGRVIGVGIVGNGAGELISEGVLAVELGATASDLRRCVHPHPTLSETIFETAEVFLGQSTHIYRPKRM